MKLKLHGTNLDVLYQTLMLINNLRKFIIIRFTNDQLIIISQNNSNGEPQVWCKLNIKILFDDIDIQSIRDNTITIELNIDLLLQTLRNFDKANSDGLFIRLQRKDSGTGTTAGHGDTGGGGRTASLALFYVNINQNSNVVNHIFRIPIKILKNGNDLLHEPEHSNIGLVLKLPNQFSNMYKRLDKFKRSTGVTGTSNDTVTIKASKNNGGYLGFILEEDGKFKVTISWNDKLEVQKPNNNQVIDHDSLRDTMYHPQDQPDEEQEGTSDNDDMEITVRLRDWQMGSKLVSQCHSVLLLIGDKDCALVCSLDGDNDDCEIVYYINGLRKY
ncbi:MEC3 [[Candida] subhashii]|uniref:MEC3 n=1 Tax=[Candida] subhashii TaxID=561895 RepID=A0A8J5UEP4_9ASCO|nr:MEC3 [[Candida] subhashii]KAG7661353.1 MEC3 [[Candida] subhashii]